MTDTLRNRIKLMIVEANSRTIPRRPDELLEVRPELWDTLRQVEAMHGRGEFRGAAETLVHSVPEETLFDDPWATNALGLSLSQDGNEEEAWPFFLRTEQLGLAIAHTAGTPDRRKLGLERAARGAINLAVSTKKVSHYVDALAAAERAIVHAPWFWPGYTALIAALEGRSNPGDRERALEALREMFSNCPDASNNPEVIRALTKDVDYADLHRDPKFEVILKEANGGEVHA